MRCARSFVFGGFEFFQSKSTHGKRERLFRACAAVRWRHSQFVLEPLDQRMLLSSVVAPISSLFNTGVQTNNPDGTPAMLVAQGDPDPHYRLGGIPAFVTLANGSPVGNPWLPDSSMSQWISPDANENGSAGGLAQEPGGDYAYTTTFDLAGYDPSTASITGQIATDDTTDAIILNGKSLGSLSSVAASMTSFSIGSGFISGANTLEFQVLNYSGYNPNPTGLQVAMRGQANLLGPGVFFLQQPSDVVSGGTVPPLYVHALDQSGNPLSGDAITISLSGSPPSAISGALTQITDVDGIATFSDLAVNATGTFTFSVSDANSYSASTDSFAVEPLSAAQLSFGNALTPGEPAGETLAPLSVRASDSGGNFLGGVAVAISVAGGPASMISGTLTETTDNTGTAYFRDLVLADPGTYTLNAADADGATALSGPVVVLPPPPAELVFTQLPADITAGQLISPGIQIEAEDASGTPLPAETVTLSIASGPTSTIYGSLTELTDNNGIATFSGLSINTSGIYVLQAISDGAVGDSSNLTVRPGTATSLGFRQQPADVGAGNLFNPPIAISATDQFGNPVPNDAVTLSATGIPAALISGTITESTDSTGVATFADISLNTGGIYKLQATDGSIQINSAAFTVVTSRLTNRIYVDAAATGNNDGSDWADAYTSLQTALAESLAGDVIEVAQGTYCPTTDTNRNATFRIKSGIQVYGGYAGSIDTAASRNPATYPTILSGDIGRPNDNTDNSYNVVSITNQANSTTFLDGVTITGGNAVDARNLGEAFPSGAGLLIANNRGAANQPGPIINDCIFVGNVASGASPYGYGPNAADAEGGGAVYIFRSAPTLSNCVFENNSYTNLPNSAVSAYLGGGALVADQSAAVRLNCVFTANSAIDTVPTGTRFGGGAILTAASSLTLTNCTFSSNSVSALGKGSSNTFSDAGGAIAGTGGTQVLNNCVFDGNAAPLFGGVILDGSLSMNGCQFTGNAGGGMFIGAPTDQLAQSISIAECNFIRNAGGGVSVQGGSNYAKYSVIDCAFDGNIGGSGGMRAGFYANQGFPMAVIANCSFVGNSVAQGVTGGGLFWGQRYLNLDDCTFTQNSAASGSAVANNGNVTTANCIFWNDTARAGAVSYSDLQNLAFTTSSINADPQFIRTPSPGPDGLWGTPDDDYGNLQLLPTSPCIDAGSNTAVPVGLTTDLAGNPRVVGAAVDMGSYEFQNGPYHFAFSQQPTNAVAGAIINPGIVVEALDTDGNPVSRLPVTLLLSGNSNGISGTLTQTTDSNGLATFGDISVSIAGLQQLTALSGVSAGLSAQFTVAAAAPARLVFVQQPTPVFAGGSISPAIMVESLDAYGNPVAGDSISLSLPDARGISLSGTLVQATSARGIAIFSGISISTAGQYSLSATDSNALADTSASFAVALAPLQLVFTQQPANVVAGDNNPVVIQALDAAGAAVSDFTINLSVLSEPGDVPYGSSSSAMTDANGLVTLNSFSITAVGTYSLQASFGSYTSQSATFTVAPAAVSGINFLQGIYSEVAGLPVQSALAIRATDNYGNAIPGVNITVAIASGPGQRIDGTLTQTTGIGGIATFADLRLYIAGSYAVAATDLADNIIASPDAEVDVYSSPVVGSLAFVGQPFVVSSSGAIANATVLADDQYGNPISGTSITVSLADGPFSALSGTIMQTTGSNGIAVFSNLVLHVPGTYMLTASSGAFATTSTSITLLENAISPKIYVDAAASGTGDGSNWSNAAPSLQAILPQLQPGTTVLVAQGTYPTESTYQLMDGITLDGGYAGVRGVNPDARDPSAFPTILTATPGDSIVNASNTDASAVLDGFTITGGDAIFFGGGLTGDGGGLSMDNGSPTIIDCIFENNFAQEAGGGLAVTGDSSPSITNCIFKQNTSLGGGGGLSFHSLGTLVLTNCVFEGNIVPNTTTYFGGALDIQNGTATLTNCLICGNSATLGGGILAANSSVSLNNCTIAANVAMAKFQGGLGAAVYNANGFITITNSIIYQNQSAASTLPIFGTYNASYSDIQKGRAGSANINADPQFIRNPSPGPDGVWGTADDDYGNLQLQPTSPCIDAGSNDAVPSGLTTDLAGNPRIVGAAVDMGAYEYQAPQITSFVINDGAPQRSAITSVSVSFNEPVALSSGAFTLTNSTGQSISYQQSSTDNQNWLLSFSNSLPDSMYTLKFTAAQAANALPPAPAVANAMTFWRLYGDYNGDGMVDFRDLLALSQSVGQISGQPGYHSYMDYNNDGAIDFPDLLAFAQNVNKTDNIFTNIAASDSASAAKPAAAIAIPVSAPMLQSSFSPDPAVQTTTSAAILKRSGRLLLN